ncbi:Zinc finger CCCH domain-containing protein 37 [Diplonema papillatum]|nr:Zinc finger CCCH domain-containing protein 37 [Diplonema papillatum]
MDGWGEDGGATANGTCRHWLQRRCTYGSTCRFQHPGAPPDSSALPSPANNEDGAPGSIPPHLVPGQEKPFLGVCRHWLALRCTYGDDCQFDHPPGQGRPVHQLAPEHVPQEPAAPADVCRHWLESKCSYGTACRFPHGKPAGRAGKGFQPRFAAPAVVAEAAVCRHFLTGTCTFGATCRFEHRQQNPTRQAHHQPYQSGIRGGRGRRPQYV